MSLAHESLDAGEEIALNQVIASPKVQIHQHCDWQEMH